jgi:hypothetical protein
MQPRTGLGRIQRAENRPMQMNWLRLTPTAMKHESVRKKTAQQPSNARSYGKNDRHMILIQPKGGQLKGAIVSLMRRDCPYYQSKRREIEVIHPFACQQVIDKWSH